MSTGPVPPGPQRGAPPSLEFVPIDRLRVDPAYQRAADGPQSRRIIVGMIKEWDWSLCQPLVVARRPGEGGGLYIIDGQHRHAGASKRGDIVHLPCVVLSSLDQEGEARAFVALNTKRQALSQFDIFAGMLAAGDANAKATAALIEATGWRVVRAKSTADLKPGELLCAPRLARLHITLGPRVVEAALRVLRNAYPKEPVGPSARILECLARCVKTGGIEPKRFSAILGSARPWEWMGRADRRRAGGSESQVEALTQLLRIHLTAAEAPEPVVLDAGNAAHRLVFGAAGKGWCEQCQGLINLAAATACSSPFCKMKAAL